MGDPRDEEDESGGGLRTTITLGVIFAGLVLFVTVVNPRLGGGAAAPSDKRVLRFFQAKDAAKVEATKPDGSALVLVREPDATDSSTEFGVPETRWRLEKPVADEADHAEARRVINALEWLEANPILEGQDAKDYPFGDVALKVSIERKDQKAPIAFEVGPEKLGKRPVRVAGDERVFMVGKETYDNLAAETWKFRNKQLVQVAMARIDRAILRSQDPKAGPGVPPRELALTRHDGSWRLGATDALAKGAEFAERPQVDELLGAAVGLRAAALKQDGADAAALAALGLAEDAPRGGSLFLEHVLQAAPPASTEPGAPPPAPAKDEAEKVTVLLGDEVPGKAGQRFARLAGKATVYEVDATALKPALERDPAAWRSDVVFQLGGNAGTVAAIGVKLPDGAEVGLEKREGAWRFDQKSGGATADASGIDALVRDLIDLRIKERLAPLAGAGQDLKALGLDPPTMAIRVIEEDKLQRELQVGKPVEGTPGRYHCLRPDVPGQVVLVDLSTLPSRLQDAPLELLDRSMFTASHWDALEVTISDPTGKVLLEARKSTDQGAVREWKVTGQADASNDTFDGFMRSAFETVKTDRYVAKDSPEARARFGLDKPTKVTVVVETFKDGKKEKVPQTLLVGARQGDRVHAVPETGPAIGLIDASFLDRVARGFAKGTVLLEHSRWDANGLTVTEAGKTLLAVKKPGENWKLGDGTLVDEKEVEELLSALEKVEVTKAEPRTPARLAETGLDAPARVVTVTLRGFDGKPETTKVLQVGKRASDREVFVTAEGSDQLGLLFDDPLRKVDAFITKHPIDEGGAFPPAPPPATDKPAPPATEKPAPPATEKPAPPPATEKPPAGHMAPPENTPPSPLPSTEGNVKAPVEWVCETCGAKLPANPQFTLQDPRPPHPTVAVCSMEHREELQRIWSQRTDESGD
jgi:hypothetical protein